MGNDEIEAIVVGVLYICTEVLLAIHIDVTRHQWYYDSDISNVCLHQKKFVHDTFFGHQNSTTS